MVELDASVKPTTRHHGGTSNHQFILFTLR
jgi:hypothetical protein